MGNLRRQIKKIISIVLIITILMSVMPNFGLLNRVEASDIHSGVIMKLNKEKGIWQANDKNVISVDIIAKNIECTAIYLPIKFNPEKVYPGGYNRKNVLDDITSTSNLVTNINSDANWNASQSLIDNINDGSILLDLEGDDGNRVEFVDEQVICTINFIIYDDSITDINKISDDILSIDTTYYDDMYRFAIYDLDSADDTGYLDMNMDYMTYINTYFQMQNISMLPTVQSLSVEINPTSGKTYEHGDKIDLTGGKLLAHYTNGSDKEVSMLDSLVTVKPKNEKDEIIADFNNPQLTFEYEGVSTSLAINVIDPIDYIEFYDKNDYLSDYEFNAGDEIPKEELFIKTTTKSGVKGELPLTDSKISLDSDIADESKIKNPHFDVALGQNTGMQDITITYNDGARKPLTTSFSILVNDKVGEIKISTKNSPQSEFTINDKFEKSGAIEVIGERSGTSYGEIEMSLDNVYVTEQDGTEVKLNKVTESKKLKVEYAGQTTEYEIKVKNTVVGIKVNMKYNPLPLEYNEELKASDFSGITITEIMADGTDGTTKNLEYSWLDTSTFNKTSVAKQDIVINYPYNGSTIKGSIPVQVMDKLLSLEIKNLQTDYVYQEQLNFNGADIFAVYASGNIRIDESLLSIAGFDSTKIEQQQVTFTYTDNIDTVSTTITVTIDKATPTYTVPTDLEGYEGEELSSIDISAHTGFQWTDNTEVLPLISQKGSIYSTTMTFTPTDTAHYKEVTGIPVDVKVKPNLVNKVEIVHEANQRSYYEGQKFNPEGMQIKVTYDSGKTKTIDSNYEAQGVRFTPSTTTPLQTSNNTITVEYGGQTANQTITVEARLVTSIAVTTPPTTKDYIQGQTLDLTGMIVTATYNDGTNAPITNYTTNPVDGAALNTEGQQTITVTYSGNDIKGVAPLTATTTVNVAKKVVTSIKVTQEPSKQNYVVGQTLELSGMEIEATYNDNSTRILSNSEYTASPADGTQLNTVGTETITITYTGKDINGAAPTTTTTVNVEKKVVISISATQPSKKDYVEGENLKLAGMVVTAEYNDGTSATTTEYTTSPADGTQLNTVGTQTITITYTGKDINGAAPSTTITVNVVAKAIEKIEITEKPNKVDYVEGQTFDPTGMEITVHYNDGTTRKIDHDYVAEGVTFNPSGALNTSDTNVTVDFRGKTASQTITVKEDYVVDIIIVAPSKLEYNYGDAIDLAGGKITRIWASGVKANDTMDMTKAMLSNSEIANFDNLNSIGIKGITVTANGITKTNAFQITINDIVSSIEIEHKDQLQTEYVYGDTINVKDKDNNGDLYIIVHYVGNTPDKKVVLTAEMLSGFSMTKLGQQTVIVTHEGKTDSYTINVKDEVIGIEITKEPAKRVYKVNDTVDFSDIEVRNVMKSGKEGTVLASGEYTITGANTASVGEQTVTVTKNGTNFTDTFKITVIDGTAGIKVSKRPKDVYNYGEALDLSDGEIVVISKSGDEIPLSMTVSSVKVTGYDSYRLGTQELTVIYTYTEDGEIKTQTTTFTVTVKDYWTGRIEITALPDKLTYKYGEEINLAGGKVARVMASGAKEDEVEITGEMISGYDKQKLGKQTITVTYQDATDTFDVTVEDELLGISMNTLPNKTEYTQGEGLTLTGATINVTRLSGTEVVEITKEMIKGFDPNKVGTQIITVTYEGKTTSFAVNVKENQEIKPTNPTNPNQPSNPSNPSTPTNPSTSETETYTVTFVDYDGTVLKVEKVKKGSYATAPIVADRKGYKFLGWNRDFDVVEEDLTIQAQYEKIERAEVNVPDGKLEVEKGKDLDLSDVTITIKDEEGNDIDEIPVTEDMISGFDPNKVGTQTVTVTYVDENGEVYTTTFTVRVTRPVETLGEKDKVNQDNVKDTLIPAAVGLGITGLLLLLISAFTKKNVEVYAVTSEERKLLEKQKISKNEKTISIKEYQEENENIEIVINSKIAHKLDGENIEIITKDGTETYKINAQENEDFVIKM